MDDLDKKEIEAIKFMIDEIDVSLPRRHPYRSRLDTISQQFYSSGDLPDKYKTMLIKIYELVTDLQSDYDN